MNASIKTKYPSWPNHKTSKNHGIKQIQILQQERAIKELLAKELPAMLILKNDHVNAEARRLLNQALSRGWQYGQKVTQEVWESLGRTGGVVAILNIWNTMVVFQNLDNKQGSVWSDPMVTEAVYSTSYTISAVAAILRDGAWESIKNDNELLKKSLKLAISDDNAAQVARLNSFFKATAILSFFGFVANGLEAWDAYNKIKDSDRNGMEKLGQGLRLGATGLQSFVYIAQLGKVVLSRLGIMFTIGSITAPWMLTIFLITSAIYLISMLIINGSTRSELEIWLMHSIWGKKSRGWEAFDELMHLEQVINKTSIEFKQASTKPTQWQDPGIPYWRLELTLPAHTKGSTIILCVKQTPIRSYHSFPNRITKQVGVEINIDIQEGIWRQDEQGNPVYIIDLWGRLDDKVTAWVKVPFGFPLPEKSTDKALLYTSAGAVNITSLNKDVDQSYLLYVPDEQVLSYAPKNK